MVRARDSDVTLDVVLVDWACGLREVGGRSELYSPIEGEVTVRESATDRIPLRDLRLELVKRRHVGSVVPGSRYQEVMEEALGEFSRRVVRHPDILIAVQAVAAQLPEADSE